MSTDPAATSSAYLKVEDESQMTSDLWTMYLTFGLVSIDNVHVEHLFAGGPDAESAAPRMAEIKGARCIWQCYYNLLPCSVPPMKFPPCPEDCRQWAQY
jgi:hypothetical protein